MVELFGSPILPSVYPKLCRKTLLKNSAEFWVNSSKEFLDGFLQCATLNSD